MIARKNPLQRPKTAHAKFHKQRRPRIGEIPIICPDCGHRMRATGSEPSLTRYKCPKCQRHVKVARPDQTGKESNGASRLLGSIFTHTGAGRRVEFQEHSRGFAILITEGQGPQPRPAFAIGIRREMLETVSDKDEVFADALDDAARKF